MFISRSLAARILVRAGLADGYAEAMDMLPPDPDAACNMIHAHLVPTDPR